MSPESVTDTQSVADTEAALVPQGRHSAQGLRWNTVLVTGASSGIGEAFARLLAAEGSHLVLVARDLGRLNQIAEDLRDAHGVQVEVCEADLSAPVARAAIERRLSDSSRPIDLLINNAGFGTNGDFSELPISREEQQVQVNVIAVMRLTSAAVRTMLQRNSGAILNLSSIAALYPAPGSATYCATKAFLCSFGDSLFEELRGTGVSITTSLPGFTATEFQQRSGWDDQQSVPKVAWLTAAKVAADSLDGVSAGKARVVPSLGYRALVGATAPLPPSARRWLLGHGSRALR
ncbi:MAG: SDR family oxidoreductase [Microthrixaceae bacterium]